MRRVYTVGSEAECGRSTAIMAAAGEGHTDVVEVLIAAGADLAARGYHGYGRAPITAAAHRWT